MTASLFTRIQHHIRELFTTLRLQEYLPETDGFTEQIALEWVLRAGKRWRPLLTVATYQALTTTPPSGGADFAALAIELLHKASLIHDDIEDGDLERYGQPTLHAQHGIPIAVNVGDFLIGEGYRVLSEAGAVGADVRSALVGVTARGQRKLTLGQGGELAATAGRTAMPGMAAYIELAQLKTGSAFEVALLLGATLAGAAPETFEILSAYSSELGVAYQMLDDIGELSQGAGDFTARRPTVLLALAKESPNRELKLAYERWDGGERKRGHSHELQRLLEVRGVVDAAHRLAERSIGNAQEILGGLPSAALRELLHYVTIVVKNGGRYKT